MAWHHGNIRRGTAPLCFHRVLARNMGQQTNDAAADEAELLLISALKVCVCHPLISFSACLTTPGCCYSVGFEHATWMPLWQHVSFPTVVERPSAVFGGHTTLRRKQRLLLVTCIVKGARCSVCTRLMEPEGDVIHLQMLEKFWLKHTSFVGGSKISIADVLMVTELDMLHVLDGAPVVGLATNPSCSKPQSCTDQSGLSLAPSCQLEGGVTRRIPWLDMSTSVKDQTVEAICAWRGSSSVSDELVPLSSLKLNCWCGTCREGLCRSCSHRTRRCESGCGRLLPPQSRITRKSTSC